MKTLQDVMEPVWPKVTIELGTRFSIVAIKTEVMVVRSPPGHPCKDCVMSSGSPFANEARNKGVTCGSLPRCTTIVFFPMTPKYIAKYTAARLTK
jgi:hypothetical protein